MGSVVNDGKANEKGGLPSSGN